MLSIPSVASTGSPLQSGVALFNSRNSSTLASATWIVARGVTANAATDGYQITGQQREHGLFPATSAVQADVGRGGKHAADKIKAGIAKTAIDRESQIQGFTGAEIFQVHGDRGDTLSGVITRPLEPVEEGKPSALSGRSIRDNLKEVVAGPGGPAIGDVCHMAVRDSGDAHPPALNRAVPKSIDLADTDRPGCAGLEQQQGQQHCDRGGG